MNPAQIHLALNHAPLFLSVIGGGLLLWGFIKKNPSFTPPALYMLMAAALFTIPVYLTGEGTEELVEHMAGVNEAAIEKHEEVAKMALVIISLTGVAALAALFTGRSKKVHTLMVTTAMLLSLASFITMAQAAHRGGMIRHTEMNNGAAAAAEQEQGDNGKEQEKDDD
ncbi:MAG: hypothetical protein JNM88_08580 [Chitinophagaceae bacterium]|nr:hypothetical protein [Chitinophagaceae bacterium]